MSYEFAVYDRARLPEILDLQKGLWSRDAGANLSYFSWKYEENPFLAGPHFYLALSGDEVIGVRGFHGTAWTVGGDAAVSTPTGGDTVIAPEHRSRGLFERINGFAVTQLAAEGFGLVCNFSAAPVTYLRSLRCGWRAVGRYVPIARDRAPGDGAGPADMADITIEPTPRSQAMTDLVRRPGSGSGIRLQRDRAFFDWRFRNPLSRYHFLYAGGKELGGYLVLQERLLKRQKGMRIVDWEARDAETFGRLLNTAIREIGSERLTIWSATLPEPIAACFAAAGFQAVDDTKGSRHYRPGPLVAAIGEAAAGEPWRLGPYPVGDLSNWQLRMACSDSC